MSEPEKTFELLNEMDAEQFQAIQMVAKILVFRKPKDNDSYIGYTCCFMDNTPYQVWR